MPNRYFKRTINFALKADFGFQFRFNDNLYLKSFLALDNLLLSTMKENEFNPRHFNFGLGLGLSYKF